MKILLIRPPVPAHTMGLKNVMICEPLELEYVAAGLDRRHEVQIFDMIIEKGLKKRIKVFQPDVIVTSCYISGVNEVKKLCREAKLIDLNIKTVVGGVHASQCPEDFSDPAVDVIVMGDGTTVLPEIIEAWDAGEDLGEIPGLAFPSGEDEVEKTAHRHYMPKPDSLPLPRRELVKHLAHRYYYLFHQPVATMKTTWGCWYKCNFCFTWRITDGAVHSRSPESIVKELETIEAEDIYIVDDIFLIKPSRMRKLADLMAEKGIKKKFLVYGRADFIAQNEPIIKEWAEIGLSAVLIGLEAATDSELESMDKECSVDYNREAIAVLHRCGVDTYGSLIPDPNYTQEDWDRLGDFIEETGLYYLNVSPLTPLPGTLIFKKYEDQVVVPRKAHGLWDLSHPVLPTKMPLKKFYKSLFRTYARASLDPRRARKYTHRTAPPIWSWKYFRLFMGAIRIWYQMTSAHKHHSPKEIQKAMEVGPEVPGLTDKGYPGVPKKKSTLNRIDKIAGML